MKLHRNDGNFPESESLNLLNHLASEPQELSKVRLTVAQLLEQENNGLLGPVQVKLSAIP